MAYVADPDNPLEPSDGVAQGRSHAEIRALKEKINNEISLLETADTDLQTAISDEATARTAADNSLGNEIDTVSGDLLSFSQRTDNPHNVTKTQVGLGNLPNAKSSTPVADEEEVLATVGGLAAVVALIENEVKNNLFHVGFILHTDDNRNPADIYGFGVWQRISAERVMVAREIANASSPYHTVGNQNGVASVTLLPENMPPHNHPDNIQFSDAGHSHQIPAGGFSGRKVDGGTSGETSSGRGTVNNTTPGSSVSGNAVMQKAGGVQNSQYANSSFSVRPRSVVTNIWRRIE